MRYILLSILLLLGLTIMMKKRNSMPRHSLKNGTLLAFGDSLSYGYGTKNPSRESYPAVLARLTGQRVINAGVNGETTAEGLQRIDTLLQQYQPGLTLLCLGGNDLLQRIPEERIRANLAAMIEKVQAAGSELLLIGVPDLGILGLKSLPLYEELSDKYGVPMEGEALPAILNDRRLKSDPIHPNAEGYRLLAEKIYEKLKEEGLLYGREGEQ